MKLQRRKRKGFLYTYLNSSGDSIGNNTRLSLPCAQPNWRHLSPCVQLKESNCFCHFLTTKQKIKLASNQSKINKWLFFYCCFVIRNSNVQQLQFVQAVWVRTRRKRKLDYVIRKIQKFFFEKWKFVGPCPQNPLEAILSCCWYMHSRHMVQAKCQTNMRGKKALVVNNGCLALVQISTNSIGDDRTHRWSEARVTTARQSITWKMNNSKSAYCWKLWKW